MSSIKSLEGYKVSDFAYSVCEGIVEFKPHAKDTINYAIMMIELLLEPYRTLDPTYIVI